jgi:CheY-like chemotaxis protein
MLWRRKASNSQIRRSAAASTSIRSKGLAEKAVSQVRDLALLLRPSMLDDLGLTPALNGHARETSKRTGLNVVVSADDAIDSLPDEHRTRIYPVKEAANNAVRHANARVSCAAWACWVWKSGFVGWEVTSQLVLSQGEDPGSCCRWPNWTKGMDMMPIRILLADDQTVVRDGLRAMLERESDMTIVAEAADGRESVRLAETEVPDVVVMDLAMPNMNGMEEATRRTLAANPRVGVVILSMHQEESYILGALKAGAKGYLLKNSMRGEVINAIRVGVSGALLPNSQGRPNPPGGLYHSVAASRLR